MMRRFFWMVLVAGILPLGMGLISVIVRGGPPNDFEKELFFVAGASFVLAIVGLLATITFQGGDSEPIAPDRNACHCGGRKILKQGERVCPQCEKEKVDGHDR